MLNNKICVLGAWLLSVSSSTLAGLPGGISGAWFNPEQSGHGLNIEVLTPDRAIAIWHVFDTSGAPLTLYIDGRVEGRHLSGIVYAPSGMPFGSFDPTQLVLPQWGSAEIDMVDCNSGSLRWIANDSEFGNGEMPLVRLTRAAGSECRLPPANALRPGLYHGNMQASGIRAATQSDGIVDLEGQLWALERYDQGGQELAIAGPGWSGLLPVRVLKAQPIAVNGELVSVHSAMHSANAFWDASVVQIDSTDGQWRTGGAVASGEFTAPAHTLYSNAQSWSEGPRAGSGLFAPVSLDDLSGSFDVLLGGQLTDIAAVLQVANDGTLCLELPARGEACAFAGQLGAAEGEHGLLDFALTDRLNSAVRGYRGRGWLAQTSLGFELVLVGDNGTQGLALIGRPRRQ